MKGGRGGDGGNGGIRGDGGNDGLGGGRGGGGGLISPGRRRRHSSCCTDGFESHITVKPESQCSANMVHTLFDASFARTPPRAAQAVHASKVEQSQTASQVVRLQREI
eukprot:5408610-Pleurochrysis_carterae.AAC.1